MSFIIQGVDLPKGYKALHMRVQSDGVVRYLIEGDDPVHIIDGARAIQIPKDHGRLIDVDELSHNMYHQAFETDSDMQKWESGCWIRYKMFEIERDNAPTILEAEGEW